ncbi:unnamed protein product, partial [marine sediment metagenome]
GIGWSTYNKGAYDNIQKNIYPFGRQDTLHPWGRSQWYDRVYLNTDSANFNVNTDLQIGNYFHNNDIYPGKTFPAGVSWNVPDNLPVGDYWLHIFANATRSVFEYPGLPQVIHKKITVVKPDLSVPTVNAPTTGNSGQPVSVNYTVANNSQGAVSDRFRKDYIYLGNNPTFDGTAVQIDSVSYSTYNIPSKGSVALQKQVTLPNGISGAKYVFVKANGAASFSETTFANNTSVNGAPINITLTPPPDLTITSINMPATVSSNTGFPFAYTLNNTGS